MKTTLKWAMRECFLLIFQPTRFVEQVTQQYQTPIERLSYVCRFVGIPILFIWTISGLVAYLCAKMEWSFSGVTTVKSLSVGVIASLVIGLPAAMRYGVAYGLAFGMSAGVIVGYPCAVWLTIPIPGKNDLHKAIASPERTLMVGIFTGILGGLLIHTISAVLGKMTRAIAFSIGFGILYGVVVANRIDPYLGFLGGAAVGILFAIGFTQRKPILGCLFFGIAYGAIIGIASGANYEATWLKWVTGAATTLAFWLCYSRLLFYPLHILIALATFSWARRDTNGAAEMWSYFPVNWDETLVFRLPCTTEFLVLLGKQDRSLGRDETMRVIASRPIHKPDALDALTILLYDDLTANSLGEIIQVMERIAWAEIFIPFGGRQETTHIIPFSGRQETLQILKAFRDIAVECEYYHHLKSRHLRIRAKIEEIHRAIENLRQILAYSEHSENVRFLNITNIWEKVIREEKKSVIQIDEEDNKLIVNPFRFGTILKEGSNFVGRANTVRLIEKSVLAPVKRALLFYGPKRTGKTSLLYHLRGLLDKRIIRVVIDIQAPKACESASAHLNYLATETEVALQERGLISESLLNHLYDLSAIQTGAVTFSLFDEWRQEIEARLGEEQRILLCIDEYELLRRAWEDDTKKAWVEDVLAQYRRLAQDSQFALMFTGSNTFEEQGNFWAERFSDVHQIRLGFLEADGVEALLKSPVPDFPIRYSQGVVEEIIRQTHCQPYLVQAVAHSLVDILNERGDLDATLHDVATAVDETLGEGQVFFSIFWGNAGKDGQEIMRAVVRGEPIPSHPDAWDWLKRNEIIEEPGRFVIPMFKQWVSRKTM